MTIQDVPRQSVEKPLPPRPALARQDNVIETLHGVTLTDPYRWLEDQDSPQTRAWIEAQDAYTRAVLAQTPGRDRITQRLTSLARIDSRGMPTVRNGVYFFSQRRADQELPVIYRRVGLDGNDEVLIDPHTLSADKTTTTAVQDISHDGALLVYGIRRGGEDELEIRFLDVASKTDLSDSLPRARYMSVALSHDNRVVYYALETDDGPRAYRHILKTNAQSGVQGSDTSDVEIFGQGYERGKYLTASVSEDGSYLLFTVYYGSAGNKTDLYIQRLNAAENTGSDTTDTAAPFPIVPLITQIEARFSGDIGGGNLYLQTNWNAPNERILAVTLADLDLARADAPPLAPEQFREIIPARADAVLEGFSLAGGHLVANYLVDVTARIQIFDPNGAFVRDIALPTLGSASGLYGQWDSPLAFYSFTSFAYPNVIFGYDVQAGTTTEWARPDVPVDTERFTVKQVFYASKDGTQIPMFLMYRKDIALDGARPTLLYGYGGFTASMTPYFSSFATVWAEQGGVYAVANLRGGGEYGEAWHQAGMLANKQNTFDDFTSAAKYLQAEGYTNPDKLAIMGGSNGGLLVGAALTQRPDLFRAVICAVPLLDMVRYHQFLVARYWIPEYGSSEDAEQFKILYAYSPYHHVTPQTRYPAVMFVTGDADTRVAPLHARKMAALLQSAAQTTSTADRNAGDTNGMTERPILLHYDTKSGHAGTKSVSKTIEDTADQLCFLTAQLSVDVQ